MPPTFGRSPRRLRRCYDRPVRDALALGLLFLTGCRSAEPSREPAPLAVEVAPAEAALPASGTATAKPSPADAGAAADDEAPTDDLARLGALCPAPPSGGRHEEVVLCGGDGRVAGIWAPVDVLHGIPPEAAEILRDEPLDRSDGRGRSLRVGKRGSRIYVKRVTCRSCRRILGWAFAGDLEALTDGDLARAQVRMGLPATPLLRTAEAWQRALAR
jgi:hypothetical protein